MIRKTLHYFGYCFGGFQGMMVFQRKLPANITFYQQVILTQQGSIVSLYWWLFEKFIYFLSLVCQLWLKRGSDQALMK